MENFNIQNEFDFKDKTLNNLICDLQTCYFNQQNNFCKICFTIFKISQYFDNNYINVEQKTNEYYDKYKLLAKFGFDKTAVSRMTNCYLKFMTGGYDGNTVSLKSWYEGFSPSKLFELLKLSNLTCEDCVDKKLIVPSMTVKEIRNYIKQLNDGKDKAEKVVEELNNDNDTEEIPMAYNPKQHYDIEYFDGLSKKQLVNCIWELQKYCEKLTGKIKTTKSKVVA